MKNEFVKCWFAMLRKTSQNQALSVFPQFCKRLSISELNFSKLHIDRAQTYAAATAFTW
jgi:hypothetical protein